MVELRRRTRAPPLSLNPHGDLFSLVQIRQRNPLGKGTLNRLAPPLPARVAIWHVLFQGRRTNPPSVAHVRKGLPMTTNCNRPTRSSVSLSGVFFITKTQQQRFKLIKCLLLIRPDRLEDDSCAAIQVGSKHFQ